MSSALVQPVGDDTNSVTTIDASTSIDGGVSTKANLLVEGKINGTVNCDGVLTIADGAEVDATVNATAIIVAGTLAGTVTCKNRLEIRSSGVVRATVSAGRLVVLEGAIFDGKLKMDAAVTRADESTTEDEPETPPANSAFASYMRGYQQAEAARRGATGDLPGVRKDDDPDN